MADRPKLCARCNKLMGAGRECPYCGADNSKIGLRVKRAVQSRSGDDGTPRVTIFFLGANVFLYALAIAVGGVGEGGGGFFGMLPPDPTVIFQLGLQSNAAIDAGDWWRVVTPVFLHLSLIHLLFNCYVLWVVGRFVEAELGGRLTFLVYMASGILGFVASYFADLDGAGASGAVSGLVGCILVRRWLVDGNLRHPAAMYALQLTVLTAIFGFLMPRVNNVAHGVGFLTGAGFAWLLTRVKIGRRGALLLMVTTLGVALVTVAALGSMLLSLGQGTIEDLEAAWGCTQIGDEAFVTTGASAPRPGDVEPQTERAPRAGATALYDLDVAKARRGVACFDRLAEQGTLSGELTPLVTPLRESLAAAAEGKNHGDVGALRQATRRYGEASRAFAEWLSESAPRYGGRFGPRR